MACLLLALLVWVMYIQMVTQTKAENQLVVQPNCLFDMQCRQSPVRPFDRWTLARAVKKRC
eukprot:3141960-Amphidinium_carterae.1